MVALFGGSFDPVHLGHLRIAEDVREDYSLEKIIFLPAYLSPLKTSHHVEAEDRLNILRLATEDNPYFDVSTYEIDKKGVSYTVDTALHYKNKLGYNPGFIVGSDAFLSLDRWKSPEILLENLNFIVILRGKDGLEDVLEFANSIGKRVYTEKKINFKSAGIYVYESRRMDISSTEIRYRIKNNLSIKYLVPEKVESYILQKNLYRGT